MTVEFGAPPVRAGILLGLVEIRRGTERELARAPGLIMQKLYLADRDKLARCDLCDQVVDC